MIDLDTLHDTYTEEQQVKEANLRPTLPTGVYYVVGLDRAEAVEASDRSPWPGRPMLSAFLTLETADGSRRGKIGLDASWSMHRRQDGKLDPASLLWGQIVKATRTEGQSVATTIQALKDAPTALQLFITESYRKPDGTWSTPKKDEDRTRLRENGAEARNFIQNVSRRKEAA